MIVNIGLFQFDLSPVAESDRRIIVIREVGNSSSEICIDMTKQQAATLADAIQALANTDA